MVLIWKCECGWRAEGTSFGAGIALTHQRSMGKEHHIRLVDKETGEYIVDEEGNVVRSLSKAQRLGLIPSKIK